MNAHNPSRIMLPSNEGYSFYEISRIIRCEAKEEKTWFYIQGEIDPAYVSLPIERYESILSDTFYRLDQDHMINLNHIAKYCLENEGSILMSDGSILVVDKNCFDKLMGRLKTLVRA